MQGGQARLNGAAVAELEAELGKAGLEELDAGLGLVIFAQGAQQVVVVQEVRTFREISRLESIM